MQIFRAGKWFLIILYILALTACGGGGDATPAPVLDADGDGVPDANDAFPLDVSESVDTDGDGVGNNMDNCPLVANLGQADFDGDGRGNACDKDLNDTGITLCGDYAFDAITPVHNNNLDCAAVAATQITAGTDVNGDPVPAGQDAVYGRDSNPSTNNDSDGHKGFSYTKLNAAGNALAIQNGIWSDAGNEADGTQWSCLQDNVTGLIWEIKTNDAGLRDKDWTYSWYNSSGINDGGDHGVGDTGVATTTGLENSISTYPGSDNCLDNARCDTEKYVADVNTATLCGASDWRLPTQEELSSLVAKDRTNPTVDTLFIPNTASNFYWSASPSASNSAHAWYVKFVEGYKNVDSKQTIYYVRLVRGGL